MLRLLLVFLAAVLVHPVAGQDPQLDSLKRALATAPKDTLRVNLLFALAKGSMGSSPKDAQAYSQEMLSLSRSLNYQKGVALAYKWSGIAKFNQGGLCGGHSGLRKGPGGL